MTTIEKKRNDMLKDNKREIIIPVVFVLALSLISCFSYFSDNLYVGHDAFFHMHRIVGSMEALQDHQFLPKIYPYTNNGYGYASPLFYCDLFIYPFAILYYLGVPLVISYKTMLIFYNILTIIITLVVAKLAFADKKYTPYFVTIVYVFSNYRLYDVYVRHSFGEILAFAFLPIIVYAVYKMTILRQNCFVLLGVGFSLLAMSHNISFALICFGFGTYLIYYYCDIYLFHKDDRGFLIKLSLNVLKSVIVAVLLSAWYLFPMLEQFLDQKFLVNQVSLMYDLSTKTLPVTAILNPLVIIDEPAYLIDQIINVGYVLLFVPFLYFAVPKNRHISFFLMFAYLLLMAAAGLLPIYKIEILTFIQFLFRLFILIYPLLTIVCAYIFSYYESSDKIAFCKIILVIVTLYSFFNCLLIQYQTIESDSVIGNYDVREEIYDPIKETSYRDHNGLEISAGEYLPTTEIVDYLEETTFIKEVSDDGYLDIIYDYDRSFTKITFTYDNPDGRKMIMLPQTYYKGYQVYEIIDGKEIPIETINNPIYKKVCFYADEGVHTYTSRYIGTFVQHITLVISLASLTLLIGYEFYKYKLYNGKRKRV